MSGTSWDDTNRSLTLTGATVTTSNPVLNLSQTWNAGAVTFTGIKLNVINTTSAGGSKLLDLQTGGSPKFSVWVDGTTVQYGDAFYIGGTTHFFRDIATTAPKFQNGSTNAIILLGSTGGGTPGLFITQNASEAIGFLSGNYNNSADTVFTRAAAATMQLGFANAAAPVAQTLQVQSVVAGTSNTAGADFSIGGSKGTGTGLGGKIIFQTAQAGSTGTAQNALSNAWAIDGNLTLYPAASLATNMTKGFVNIPGAAGAASGTPANTTGYPMYYDATNNKIYVYNGSWRSTAALT
jgi:hypothetical protein